MSLNIVGVILQDSVVIIRHHNHLSAETLISTNVTDLVELVPGVLVLAAPEAVPGDVSGLGEVLPADPPSARPLVTSLGAPGPEMWRQSHKMAQMTLRPTRYGK